MLKRLERDYDEAFFKGSRLYHRSKSKMLSQFVTSKSPSQWLRYLQYCNKVFMSIYRSYLATQQVSEILNY